MPIYLFGLFGGYSIIMYIFGNLVGLTETKLNFGRSKYENVYER